MAPVTTAATSAPMGNMLRGNAEASINVVLLIFIRDERGG